MIIHNTCTNFIYNSLQAVKIQEAVILMLLDENNQHHGEQAKALFAKDTVHLQGR
ncbi:MAG TPA: hypothetical protein VKR53_06030 [Puia sp.]|nr:hypothetical protein [Puia sp.]